MKDEKVILPFPGRRSMPCSRGQCQREIRRESRVKPKGSRISVVKETKRSGPGEQTNKYSQKAKRIIRYKRPCEPPLNSLPDAPACLRLPAPSHMCQTNTGSRTCASPELECSVCLDYYKDPVILECGHNYCRECIGRVFDTQEGSGGYSCPECKQRFGRRPALQRNLKLRNIVETFLSAQPDEEYTGVSCTHCIHSSVPAVKTCLLCEASLCDNHLTVHSKSPEHVLCDPTTNLETRKCSVHKELMKYCCTEDSACIWVSFSLSGQHRGHQVETLDEIHECTGTHVYPHSTSKGIGHINAELTRSHPQPTHTIQHLHHQAGGPNFGAGQKTSGVSAVTDILLDVRTAGNSLLISDDKKTATWSSNNQNRPETRERFQRNQVISRQRFSSGRHSWEVDVGGSVYWRVGMCYPSMDRQGGNETKIGYNNKSWSLERRGVHVSVMHYRDGIQISGKASSDRVRIDLDYEAGRISFYDLCDPIRHLHTFTTTFTEPLHAVLCVWGGCLKISGGNRM
ncbi:tripartite motif-containing protein 75-like [Mantella aurantiaca]